MSMLCVVWRKNVYVVCCVAENEYIVCCVAEKRFVCSCNLFLC